MGLLIAILNNISDWLVLKLSKKIILNLWWNLDQACFECDVIYNYHTCQTLSVDIIVENEKTLSEEVKMYGIVGDINDKYSMISLQATIYTREQYREIHGG
jgi:hypothetical protein